MLYVAPCIGALDAVGNWVFPLHYSCIGLSSELCVALGAAAAVSGELGHKKLGQPASQGPPPPPPSIPTRVADTSLSFLSPGY